MSGESPSERRATFARPIAGFDEVLECDAHGITARRAFDAGEDYFRGHYPDFKVFPGVFIIELAQQAGHLYCDNAGLQARLRGVRSCRFLSAFFPGETMVCRATAHRSEDGSELKLKATAWNGETKSAVVTLLYDISESSS